jgi:hypothetical protein
MAKFKLEIESDNAAFEFPDHEISRILKDLSEQVAETPLHVWRRHEFLIRDTNGNRVGTANWSR